MSDLGWRADGIDRALTSGGVELEVYRRPGFVGGLAVRRAALGAGGAGVPADWPDDVDPECLTGGGDPLPRARGRPRS